MPDDPSDNEQAWWMPPGRPDPPEPGESPDVIGQMHSTRPIGPMSLRSATRRPYILAGVAVAALLGGAGAALAATSSAPPSPAASSSVAATPVPSPSPGPPGTHAGFRHFRGPGFPGGSLFGALHGQFVIGKSGGGYQTVDAQNGQVTAVSSTSITLKSADGFTHTYAVASSTIVDAQRDGIGSVKVGNQAAVLATVSGSTTTATSITDLTLLQQEHPGFGSGSRSSGGQPG
jgi:hypothetical protein